LKMQGSCFECPECLVIAHRYRLEIDFIVRRLTIHS
jgi:hypothetical protein